MCTHMAVTEISDAYLSQPQPFGGVGVDVEACAFLFISHRSWFFTDQQKSATFEMVGVSYFKRHWLSELALKQAV